MTGDREFIDAAAKGLRIEPEPFRALARELGLSEDEVIERLRRLIAAGKVRRFAASVRHQPMGYEHNAMVIARVSEPDLDRVGRAGSALEAVSHCYHRDHPDGDPWCLYFMVHGLSPEAVAAAIEVIRSLPGVRGIEVLASAAELKKTSVSGVSTDLSGINDSDEHGTP